VAVNSQSNRLLQSIKTKKMNWNYLFRHWFSTLLFVPIIFQFLENWDLNQLTAIGFLELFPAFLTLGLFFSIPTYILYSILYYYLAQLNFKFSKLILILFSIVGIVITASIIGGTMMPNVSLAYCLSSIITGLFFKLNFEKPENNYDQNKTPN